VILSNCKQDEETSLWLCSLSIEENHKKRDKQLKSQIKVIKRNREIVPTDGLSACESKSVEPSAREITIAVKSWIAESRQRKRNQKEFSSLFPLR